jgi:hypothetical protein
MLSYPFVFSLIFVSAPAARASVPLDFQQFSASTLMKWRDAEILSNYSIKISNKSGQFHLNPAI